MFDLIRAAFGAIKLLMRVSRKHKGDTLSWSEFHARNGSQQMVFLVVEPTVFFHRQEAVAVPLVPCFELRIGAQKIERSGSVEGHDAHSVPDGFNLHSPISCMRAGVKVAIVDERFHRETKRTAGPEPRELDVSGVFALTHPNAFFEQGVAEREPPHRYCVFQAKTFDVEITLGLDGAARPAIGGENVLGAVVAGGLLQFSD